MHWNLPILKYFAGLEVYTMRTCDKTIWTLPTCVLFTHEGSRLSIRHCINSSNEKERMLCVNGVKCSIIKYSITWLNRKRLNRIYWMNVKIYQVRNFSFLYLCFFKSKLSLNRSKSAGPLRFGLTMLYCTSN